MTSAEPSPPPAGPARSAGAAVVVLAGGSGTRLGGQLNKVYLPLAGRRVISWSFTWARRVPAAARFVLVARAQDLDLARQVLALECPGLPVELVVGGASRHASEQAALDHLAPAIRAGAVDVVAIHDGARPLAGTDLFRRVLDVAAASGGAVPALPAGGLIPARDPGVEPGHRPDGLIPAGATGGLVRVQTPQAFRAAPLLEAYAAARAAGYQGTDTSACLEAHSPVPVRTVPGHRHNLKVTYAGDLPLAERLLAAHAGTLY